MHPFSNISSFSLIQSSEKSKQYHHNLSYQAMFCVFIVVVAFHLFFHLTPLFMLYCNARITITLKLLRRLYTSSLEFSFRFVLILCCCRSCCCCCFCCCVFYFFFQWCSPPSEAAAAALRVQWPFDTNEDVKLSIPSTAPTPSTPTDRPAE